MRRGPPGIGTVVTGMPAGGRIAVGDRVERGQYSPVVTIGATEDQVRRALTLPAGRGRAVRLSAGIYAQNRLTRPTRCRR